MCQTLLCTKKSVFKLHTVCQTLFIPKTKSEALSCSALIENYEESRDEVREKERAILEEHKRRGNWETVRALEELHREVPNPSAPWRFRTRPAPATLPTCREPCAVIASRSGCFPLQ